MEPVIKGKTRKVEFGDYGNFADLTPEAVHLVNYDKHAPIHAVVTYSYGDGRTIDLCHDRLVEIDFESFDTTFDDELSAIGYSQEGIKFNPRNGLAYIDC